MTENEAIKVLVTQKQCIDKSSSGQCKINCGDCKKNIPIAYQEKSYEVAITALKEVQRYREIGTIEEIRKMINQGINNCYMSHKYEHPGYEEGMCAGLRTMNGDGEPVYKCKLCRLNYLFERSEGE